MSDDIKWSESHATGSGKAFNHALVEWRRHDDAIVVKINGVPALRFSVRLEGFRLVLRVEQNESGATGETYGACIRAGKIAQNYSKILEAHNDLGDLLNSSRRFITASDEELAPPALTTAQSEP